MAVSLNGLEKIPREQREQISVEEFQKLIDLTSIDYEQILSKYIMAKLFKKGVISFEIIAESERKSVEEIKKEFESEFGITDLNSISMEDFLVGLDEEVLALIPQIDAVIDTIHSIYDYFNSSEFGKIIAPLEKRKASEFEKVAKIISSKDLSAIPPEMFYELKFLKYINFENTGAKLDFANISDEYDIFISCESLRGCEIISYFPDKHRLPPVESEFSWNICNITCENVDREYYQVILDGFKGRSYVHKEILDFLNSPEMIKANKWLVDLVLHDKPFYFDKFWKILPQELKPDFKDEFEKIVEEILTLEPSHYINCEILSYTPLEMLQPYIERIESGYRKEDGSFDTSFYEYNGLYQYMPVDYQENHYLSVCENKNLTIEDKLKILQFANIRLKEKVLMPLIDSQIELEQSPSSVAKLIQQLGKREYDDSHMLDFLNFFGKDAESFSKLPWYNFSAENQLKYYEMFVKKGLEVNADKYDINCLFKNLPIEIREAHYDELLEIAEKYSPELTHYIRGKGFLEIVNSMDAEKRNELINNNPEKILAALREEYRDAENPYEDQLSPDYRAKFDHTYNSDMINILLSMYDRKELNKTNVNVIIDNLPRLGSTIINRLFQSNSEMIQRNASQLISAVSALPREAAIKVIEETERVFAKDTVPDFMKIFKFYENVVERKEHVLSQAIRGFGRYSPELQQAKTEQMGKRIIFTDLLNISLNSNNKSLRNFFETLEKGNQVYMKYLNGGKDVKLLSEDERAELQRYSDTLFMLYEESGASRFDKNSRKGKLQYTSNPEIDLERISKRYLGDQTPRNLSDVMLRAILGPYDELVGGKKTVRDFLDYMDKRNRESNERHAKLAKQKLVLEPGDLIKGVGQATEFLQDLFSNGIRAGEFLGVDTHTDLTPLDSDHSLILPRTIGTTLSETISKTASSGYGASGFYVVIKKDKNKIQYTRDNADEVILGTDQSSDYKSQLGRNADRAAIKRRIANRANGTFEEPKLEAFSSAGRGGDHYGIRTGMGITDIDYIVTSQYDKRIGYELAMNGTFIPVVDLDTNEVVFGIDDYNKIRDQMRGLSYYRTGEFQIDSTAYSGPVEEMIRELFPDGNVENSISERDASAKRNAIQFQISRAINEKLGLGISYKVTGDISPGFIEFIDTGSTGRGTNLPGDGDFDFSLKVDRTIKENPSELDRLQQTLREVLAIKSEHEECALNEFNGNFRYKKVNVEGIEQPLDIDITFMEKSSRLQYSTDMAVKDRLDGLKKSDPEAYKVTIANIVLAKRMLKEAGIYKKASSDKATPEGGFGGVGVENWILQNGGSFYKAMETFLEAANKEPDYHRFMERYPIFDFGQNHTSKGYQHDSFVRGMSEKGFKKMQEKFKEFQQILAPQKAPVLTIRDLTNNAVKSEITISEIDGADMSMSVENLREGQVQNIGE